MPYSTKQHQAVLRCLEARGETACTAAELAEDLRREGCPVGLATIYRQLEKLEAAGAVHKVNTEEGALYQYCGRQSQGHRDCFLLKCERCGRIRHVDCMWWSAFFEQKNSGGHGFPWPPLGGFAYSSSRPWPHQGQTGCAAGNHFPHQGQG